MESLTLDNHLLEVFDVLPVNYEVYGECDAMGADPGGQLDLVRVRACSRDPVRRAFFRILKAKLDVVKARVYQLGQALARKPDSGRDQVRVQTCLTRSLDQFSQIRACQRLASGEVKMQHAECCGLIENPQPVGGREFFLARSQLQRIRAVHAMQWAAVRDLGNQGERSQSHSKFTN